MTTRTSIALSFPTRGFAAAVVALGCMLGPVAAEDSPPEGDKGRYTMSATPDGVIRLDTRTGSISTCSNAAGSGWSCYAVPDEALPKDQALPKSDQLQKTDPNATESKSGAPKPAEKLAEPKSADGARRIEIPLPSDQDMDRLMAFAEQAWRRLIEMANRVQKDLSGKI
jgi:hypothetical protein